MAEGKYKEWLEPDNLIKLEGWARAGLIDKQIAHNIGVSEQTLNVWKKNYPLILASLKKGKEVIDYEVENALLKRALGYSYLEKRTEYEMGMEVKTIVTEKQVLPDVTAQIFWLKNRKPGEWREKANVSVQLPVVIKGENELLD